MSLLWRRVQQSPSTCSSPPFPQLQPAPAENCHCLFGGFTCLMISQTQSRAESHLPANSVCLYSWGLALDPCFGLALRRFCRGVCHGRKQGGRCRAPSHGESASADSGQVCPSSPGQAQPHCSSGQRGERQRGRQDSRKSCSLHATNRSSPREGRTHRPVGGQAGNRHWRVLSLVRPCYDAQARPGWSFGVHGTGSWQAKANMVGVVVTLLSDMGRLRL